MILKGTAPAADDQAGTAPIRARDLAQTTSGAPGGVGIACTANRAESDAGLWQVDTGEHLECRDFSPGIGRRLAIPGS